MAASYPGSIKSFTTKTDNVTDVLAAHVNDLQDEVVAIETELAVNSSKRLAKAWGKWNGSGTPAFSVRYNLDSSITDNGTGDWTLAITTDFSTADFVCACMTNDVGSGSPSLLTYGDSSPMAAGTVRVKGYQYSSAARDTTLNTIVMFGDQ